MSTKRTESRKRDPFAVDPLPKAHYYPSPERRLNRAQKATSIKTNYSPEEISENDEGEKKLNPADEQFLKGAHSYQPQPTSFHDDEDNFDESWPCSERPSATSLPDVDDSLLDIDKYLQFNRDREMLPERIRMPGSYTAGPILSVAKDAVKPIKSKIPVRDSKLSQNGVTDGNDKMKSDKTVDDLNPSDQEGSVLQRYVDRFRNSEPMSRDEREKKAATSSQDFWWLSNGPPQIPAKKPADRDNHEIDRSSHSSALTKENLDRYRHLQNQADGKRFNGFVPDSPNDKRIIELQERADKLLEKSSSTVLSTEPAVSTEGLGSNVSDMSSLEEYSHKPAFAQYLAPEVPAQIKQLVPPPLPRQRAPSESDPLYQWRLRRKMELAQQSAPQQTAQFNFLSKSDQQKKMDSKLEEFKQRLAGRVPSKSQVQFTPAPISEKTPVNACYTQQITEGEAWQPQIASPSLHRTKPKTESQSDIDPHLHLMCDLLPCPHSGKMVQLGTSNELDQGTSIKVDSSLNKYDKGDKLVTGVGEYKQYLEAEKPDIDRSSFKDTELDKNSDTKLILNSKPMKSIQDIEKMVQDIGRNDINVETEEVDDDNIDRNSKNIEPSNKSGSNSARSDKSSKSETQRSAKENESQKVESTVKKDSKSKKETSIQPKHSSSPKNGRKGVTAAIGQVVKEHLFRTSTSTVLSSVDSLPPSASTERLPRNQKPSSHDYNLMQHVEEEEAYLSDGDFEDDNLLQMLRKQRATYEQQLQQIDEMLLKLETR